MISSRRRLIGLFTLIVGLIGVAFWIKMVVHGWFYLPDVFALVIWIPLSTAVKVNDIVGKKVKVSFLNWKYSIFHWLSIFTWTFCCVLGNINHTGGRSLPLGEMIFSVFILFFGWFAYDVWSLFRKE